MALIRQADAERLVRDAIALDLGDLTRQAEAIRARARADARRIVEEAQQRGQSLLAGATERGHAEGYERGRQEGYDAGFAEGRAAAIRQATEQLAPLQAAWAAELERFESELTRMLDSARRELVELALRIAERVVRRSIEADPASALPTVEAVLALVARAARVQLRVHPDDEPLIRDAMPALAARFHNARQVELVPDAAIERGSCVARTAGGEIDASIATQLDRIAEALLPTRTADARAHDSAPTGDGAAVPDRPHQPGEPP